MVTNPVVETVKEMQSSAEESSYYDSEAADAKIIAVKKPSAQTELK